MSVIFETGQPFEMELPGGRYKAVVVKVSDEAKGEWIIKVQERISNEIRDRVLATRKAELLASLEQEQKQETNKSNNGE